jgi:hypothetical protein
MNEQEITKELRNLRNAVRFLSTELAKTRVDTGIGAKEEVRYFREKTDEILAND